MNPTAEPITQEIVLIGGGHAHAIALRQFGMKPLPGVRLTLISEASESPYSGMVPGRVAGWYTDAECHINLAALAQFAQAQFYVDRVTGLDLSQRRIVCDRHPPIAFDLLSLNIGSIPLLPEFARSPRVIPAKPMQTLLDRWDALLERLACQPDQPLRLVIVGGGAAGVELAFAMQHRVHQQLRQTGYPLSQLEVHLIQRGDRLVPQFHQRVGNRLLTLLSQRHIQVHLNQTVTAIAGEWVCCASGWAIEADAIIWTTQATAPPWLGAAGLAVDAAGFVLVDNTLQSISHPGIFAVGDIAAMVNYPRPKAGVFAVRQGKPLAENLRRQSQSRPLRPFAPQRHYLSLINTVDGSAIAVKGWLSGRSRGFWRWKDQIDRQFMTQFTDLPIMGAPPHSPTGSTAQPLNPMPCAGCGAKVGRTVLARVLQRLPPQVAPDSVVIGLEQPDDAAVITVPAGQVWVQTVDYFSALIPDPFVFGQISANHALNDLYAMGATPHSALAIATIPSASEALVEETLYQLLSGALHSLHQAGAVLIGGHSTTGSALAFGLTCNGLAPRDRLWQKGTLPPGQTLILTKPLGTGTLFAAQMRGQALGRWIDAAVESMVRSHQAAAQYLATQPVSACTDITGFGLIGHLLEMVRPAEVAVTLDLDAIPVLPGALTTTERGIVSSLYEQNFQASSWIRDRDRAAAHAKFPLLFDPQTAGGLLVAVPSDQAAACVHQLRSLGYAHSTAIGHTLPLEDRQYPIAIAKSSQNHGSAATL